MDNIVRQKKIDYMTYAKAIGIILVVIGHTESSFTSFIYLFHMPLFFLISGYFYKDKYNKEPIKFILRRIKSIYIPFIIYGGLFVILHNFFFKVNIYNSNVSYKGNIINLYTIKDIFKNLVYLITFDATEQLAGTFWFLTSLFTVSILFCFIGFAVNRYIKNNSKYIKFTIISICFIVGNLATLLGISLPRQLNISLVALFIFYLGYLYKKIEADIPMNIYIASIAFAMLIFNACYGTLSMVENTYVNPPFLILNTILGTYLVLYISHKLDIKKYTLNTLKYIGNNTLTIMCLHFISFKIVSFIQILICGYPKYMLARFPVLDGRNGWWMAYTIVGIFAPLFVQKFIVDKLKNFFYFNTKIYRKNESRKHFKIKLIK